MSTQTKSQLNAPILLVASGLLLALQWLLPTDAHVAKLLVCVAFLFVLMGWYRWSQRQTWMPNVTRSIEPNRSKRVAASLRAIGFYFLLIGWIFAMFPQSTMRAFEQLSSGVFYWMAVLFVPMLTALVVVVIAIDRIKWTAVNSALGKQSVEDRLDELERLKRRDMVTPEEYAAKRQEILKDL